MRKIKLFIFCFFSIHAWAQHGGSVWSVASDKGNLIRFWPNASNSQELLKNMAATRSFSIRKAQIIKGELKYEEITSVSFPRTRSHFEEHLTEKDFNDLKTIINTPSNEEFDAFLASNYDIGALAMLMEIKPNFLLAFGLGVVDKNVEKGEFYDYEVIREDIQGNSINWGTTSLFAKEGNLEIQRVSVKLDTIMPNDSTVRFKWQVNIPDYTDLDFQKMADSVDREMGKFKTYTQENADRSGAIAIFNRYGLNSLNTSFWVYYKVNEEKEWKFFEKQIAGADSSKAGLFVDISIPCNPEDFIQAIVVPHDFVENRGNKSEIASAYAITINSVELIYGINARDSVNAIVLSWKQLPEKPYYAGIEISRSMDQNNPEVLQVVSPRDSSYTDMQIFPAGTIFSYYIRPIFLGVNELKWDKPATVTHSCTTFSKPSIPYGLKIIEEGETVKLSWDGVEDGAFHSYHIMRGVNPNQLNLISGEVLEKEFRDSIKNLSSRLTYYYSVMAMNLMQDTSSYSEVAAITIHKKEPVLAPPAVNFRVINKDLYLTWDDVKRNDNQIKGYLLQKDIGEGFTSLHKAFLEGNMFIDENFSPEDESHYRVASVSIVGDTSEFSPTTTLRKLDISVNILSVTNIALDNLTNKIRITWPSIISSANIQGFKVYRRLPEETNFTAIGSTTLNKFEYEDLNVSNGKTYVYAVTAINAKEQESEITEEKTIYKE
jgi:hypothetical protein